MSKELPTIRFGHVLQSGVHAIPLGEPYAKAKRNEMTGFGFMVLFLPAMGNH